MNEFCLTSFENSIGVSRSKGCKVTSHQTLRMIIPQAISNFLSCHIDLILLHKGANDWFIVSIAVSDGTLERNKKEKYIQKSGATELNRYMNRCNCGKNEQCANFTVLS